MKHEYLRGIREAQGAIAAQHRKLLDQRSADKWWALPWRRRRYEIASMAIAEASSAVSDLAVRYADQYAKEAA